MELQKGREDPCRKEISSRWNASTMQFTMKQVSKSITNLVWHTMQTLPEQTVVTSENNISAIMNTIYPL